MEEYVKEAYLDYSMYVILDRALPKLGDGLKPVQRRILFAMRELGVTHTSEFKKSARTVGDVIGKFHPHGDSAAYEAMVLMAQPFSTRYPLIQGQGNFGSIDDPKSFAAMRYTEARLTPYSQTLLSELGEGTVDFAPNFDGTIPEPLILPARLPHLLLNGTTGIAVGMATDIPSHNLGEVVDACCRVLEKSSITLDEILKLLPAPDFAGGGLIVNSAEELRQIYSTGRGSVRVQSRWRLEAPDEVAIYEIPPHISSNRLLEQLAKTVLDKKVTGIIDVRDEGDEDHPVYLKLILKPSTKNVDQIMAQLFQYTDLEKSVRINFNVINAEGYTRVLPLVDFIKQWLDGRFEVVTRRYTYRQQQAQARHHRLSGFLIAHKHIDRIIEIIRNNDTPSPIIQKEFKLSEEQTSAILDLRLRQLAKLEKTKMQEEVDALEAELKEIESLLNSPRKLKSRIKSELKKDKKEFGDPRRTVWEPQGKASIKLAVPVDKTKYTLLLSRGGWLRVLKGHLELTQENAFRGDDALLQALYTSGQEWVHFLDSEGRVYSIRAARLRETDKTDRKGVPITRWFTPTSGATFCGMCTISDPGKQNILLVTEKAKGMLIDANVPEGMRKAGKNRLNLASGDKPLNLFAVNPSLSDEIAMLVSGGRLILLEANDIPVRNIGQGVTLTKIVTELQKQKDLLGPGDADIEKLLDIAVVTGKEKCLKVKTVRSFQRFRAEGLIPFRRNRGQRPVSLPPRLKNALAIENDPAPDSS